MLGLPAVATVSADAAVTLVPRDVSGLRRHLRDQDCWLQAISPFNQRLRDVAKNLSRHAHQKKILACRREDGWDVLNRPIGLCSLRCHRGSALAWGQNAMLHGLLL